MLEVVEALVDHEPVREDDVHRGVVRVDELVYLLVASLYVFRCELLLLLFAFQHCYLRLQLLVFLFQPLNYQSRVHLFILYYLVLNL